MPQRPPDFIIGGAPRCGTTWLYHLCDRHPQLWMARPVRPEPKFFLVDEFYKRGMGFYLRTWFATIPRDHVAGEKSTNYLESPRAAVRIYQSIPNVKLIFILRDPVERAFSNYLWTKANGLEDKRFHTALQLEPEREKAAEHDKRFRYARPFAYFSRGLYADMLRPWFKLFERKKVLILRYEDIEEESQALAQRLHHFLGVAPRPADTRGMGVINAAEKADESMDERTRAELIERYAEPNRRLAEMLGPDFKMWAPWSSA